MTQDSSRLSFGEVARRCGWALLAGVVLGVFALALDPAPLALRVALSVLVALVLPLPGILFAREDTPGAANAPGTLLSLLALGVLVGLLVALETLLAAPLAGHLALVAPLLLALIPGYMLGAHGRRLRQTWPMGLIVGIAVWFGCALLLVILLALLPTLLTSRAPGTLVPQFAISLDGVVSSSALGLPGAVVGGVVGACLRVLPIARAACPDEVEVGVVTASRTSPPAFP